MIRAAALAALAALAEPRLAIAADHPNAAAGAASADAVYGTSVANSMIVADLPAIKQAMEKSRGRTLLVHFWASWCLPCTEELPVINRFAREMKGRGVDVLSVSLDNPDAAARASKLLSDKAPSLTRHLAKIDDADAFIASFDRDWQGAIPALFAFDAEGKLRGHRVGEVTRRQLDGLVASVGGKIAPAKTK